MAKIGTIDGINFYIKTEIGGKHHSIHIHARKSEFRGSFSLEGDLLAGYFPHNLEKIIREWINNNYEYILEEWRFYNGK